MRNPPFIQKCAILGILTNDPYTPRYERELEASARTCRDSGTNTTNVVEEDDPLTSIINFGRTDIEVPETGIVTGRYGTNVVTTIIFGAGKDKSRAGRCDQGEEGGEFHFVLVF